MLPSLRPTSEVAIDMQRYFHSLKEQVSVFKNILIWGVLGWLSQLSSRLLISVQVMISPVEPRTGLHAECGACLRFRLALTLCPSPTYSLSLSK